MGDKTQLLALVLTVRFKKPLIIMLGILLATLANHALAAKFGEWIATTIDPGYLRIGLALAFFAFGIWVLFPDRLDEQEREKAQHSTAGALLTTIILFFLAEMGDKTQLATIALGAKFKTLIPVTIGTTLGMLAANGLAVAFGERLTTVVPMRYIRYFACLVFVAMGIWMLVG